MRVRVQDELIRPEGMHKKRERKLMHAFNAMINRFHAEKED